MQGKNTVNVARNGRELTLTRILDAPRELVWVAWTDPAHVANWWGPNGFTNSIRKMDVRANGEWLFTMHGPDGGDYPNKIVFTKVEKPKFLAYKHSGDYNTKDVKFEVKVTFEEVNGKTRVTMRSVFESSEELDRVEKGHGAIEGGKQTLTRLGEYLENMNGGKSMPK
ncbi:MAG: SRPBCC family protein [archaeon]|nr:SRPBCC family protein [archaeon]